MENLITFKNIASINTTENPFWKKKYYIYVSLIMFLIIEMDFPVRTHAVDECKYQYTTKVLNHELNNVAQQHG